MNLKNIKIAVIGLILLIGGFLLFRKITPNTVVGTQSGTNTQPGTGTTPATPPVIPAVDPIESAISTLSENQKMDANILASKIFNDMKGWSAHDMTLYKKLFDYRTAQFVYFVVRAWPIYSSKTLQSTMLSQNWSVLTTESKRAGYDRVRAEELLQKIIYRINNTQL